VKTDKIEIISFQGGSGNNIKNAIEIVGAKNFSSGFQAEYEYITTVHSICDIESMEGKVIAVQGKIDHKINVITQKGIVKNFYFKINDIDTSITFEDAEVIKEFVKFVN